MNGVYPVVGGIESDVLNVTMEKRTEMHKALAQIVDRFKLDWRVLRGVMLTTGAVISGSAALAVLQPGEFVPQDLDIYVTSKNFATVVVFLKEQGYNVQIPTTDVHTSAYPKPNVILTHKNQTGDKIDLIATTERHVVHAITQFHSTCVMNYIAYYGIVCLYPQWTMRKTGLVRTEWADQQAINKYRGRGFAMVYAPAELPKYERTHACGTHRGCVKARRELHDDLTLFVPFEDEEFNIHTEERMRVGWVLQNEHECSLEHSG